MTIYYVREDGTQTDKNNATEGVSAATSLSVAGFNGESFAPGDEVIFLRAGGIFTSAIIPPSSGVRGSPVIYRGENNDDRTEISITTSGDCISATGEHMIIKFFNGSNTVADLFTVENNSGLDDHSIVFEDCTAITNGGTGGDGFKTVNGVNNGSQARFIRCEAQAITGGGNQGFTNHDNESVILDDCSTTAACNIPTGATGAYFEINGGTFRGLTDILNADAGCQMIVNGATVIADEASANIYDASAAGTLIQCNGCTLIQGSNSTVNNYIRDASATVEFNDCKTTLSPAAGTATLDFTADGLLVIKGGQLMVGNIGSRLFRNAAAGGRLQLLSCKVEALPGFTGSDPAFVFQATSGGNADIVGNVFINNSSGSGFISVQASAGCAETINVCNNTFIGFSTFCIDDNTSASSADINVYNNIFDDCLLPIDGTSSITKDYNAYTRSSADESDTNGSTQPAHYLDRQNEQFQQAADSPHRVNGTRWWTGGNPLDHRGIPFKDINPSRGAHQAA